MLILFFHIVRLIYIFRRSIIFHGERALNWFNLLVNIIFALGYVKDILAFFCQFFTPLVFLSFDWYWIKAENKYEDDEVKI